MNVNLNIESEDIVLMKKYLTGKILPVNLDEVVNHIALFKTQNTRKNKVKEYHQECEYKVGDLIYKEYSSKLPVGAKKYIELDNGVVLKVEELRSGPGFNQIKLSYDGTSDFRKYISYLTRQKTDLLLLHKAKKPYRKTEYIDEAIDPRIKNAPLISKDFAVLKKKIISVLQRNNEIAFTNDKILLSENLKEIEKDVFNRIRQFLTDNKTSVSTEFLVENFLKIKAKSEDFDAYCFAINFKMSTDYKIDFQQTAKQGWGKWNLISVVYHLRKDSIVSVRNPLLSSVTINDTEGIKAKRDKIITEFFDNEKTKCILTQREVSAGAVRVKSKFFDFGDDLEVEMIDTKTKKTNVFYYYSDVELLVGFKEIFKAINAVQGMSITFTKNKDGKILYSIKEIKKGTVADEIVFDKEKKSFTTTYKKIASQVFVNKQFFLETDIITEIYNNFDTYLSVQSFNKLVHKIFLNFGKKEKNYEVHAFKLYHIIDLIYPTPFEVVLDVLLGNNEFIESDKFSGVFYLDSNAIANIEEDESKRREENQKEISKKTEEKIDEQKKEELERLEAIKRKREERRIKRENEMRLKEALRREKEAKIHEPAGKKTFITEKPINIPVPQPLPEKKEHRIKSSEANKKRKDFESETPKPAKTKKRVEDIEGNNKIDIEDIKNDIKLEELKEEVLTKKKKSKKEKKEKVAYKDDGSFGGVFASILDDAVSKKDEKK